ncbi:MAG TPA: iron ABC transporter permease [Bacteroidota bacterium]
MPSSRSARQPLTRIRVTKVTTILVLALGFTAGVALSVGSVSVSFSDVVRALFGDANLSTSTKTIVLDIRLPRILLAIIVGGGLSVAGVAFQAILRNPLAEPYILGISSGGTVGAMLAIGLSFGGLLMLPLSSFLGALIVTILVYRLAHRHGRLDSTALLLSGIMVGAFVNAIILLFAALFNQEMRYTLLWLLGNLSTANLSQVAVVVPVVLLSAGILFFLAPQFNLIATGDETAEQLGVDVARIRRLSYLLGSLVTGVVVSVSGVIGFVGLIIPHICRLSLGPDHRLLFPASFLFGGIFLLWADVISRTVIAPTEIPVGVITAAIGAPLFVYLLRRG